MGRVSKWRDSKWKQLEMEGIAVHRHGIQWGIEHGYRHYDFGGTGAHFDENVFQYEARYGADAKPTVQWRRGRSRSGWPAFKLGRKVYRKRTY